MTHSGSSRGRSNPTWALLVGLCLLGGASAPALAAECTYCDQDLPEGQNELKCENCLKLSEQITKNNQAVWLLGFKRGRLGRVQMKDDTGDVENYWFLAYTLTNKDSVPHEYFIDVEARSDRGKFQHRYHDLWIPDVYAEIRKMLSKREGDQLLNQRDVSMNPPGQENELPKIGDKRTRDVAKTALPTLQPGETVECVAILGPFDPEMDQLVISVRGLTNSSLIQHDDYVAPKDEPNRRVIKEAVLELHYSRPGDEFAHDTDPLVFTGRKWVDVSRTIKSDLKWRPRNEGRR